MEYDNTRTCGNCNGSGEGFYDGEKCCICDGKGVVYVDDSEQMTGAEEAAYNYYPE